MFEPTQSWIASDDHGEMTLPAGDYLIADPSHVIATLNMYTWHNLLDETLYFGLFGSKADMRTCRMHRWKQGGVFVRDGYQYAVFGTWFGDGRYSDQRGNTCEVDSGLIGCVPEPMAEGSVSRAIARGFRITFTDDVPVSCTEGGTIRFGDVIMHTGTDDPDECD